MDKTKIKQKTAVKIGIISAGTVLVVASLYILSDAQKTYFPDGYRKWFHVKSMIIEEGHPLFSAFGGIHHIYANEKAEKGYKTGKFEDGSVIVFDLLETTKSDNTIQEGKRKVLAYMRKNSKLKETGGWEWVAFAEGDRNKQVVKDPKSECFSCHETQKDTDYVFSKIRE
jgi:hypothetical protein